MRALLVSDLHLTETRPEANEKFIGFVEEVVPGADAVYILGDLFEYWIGDDDLAEPFNALVCGFLRRISSGGTRLYVMHGNRDFLIGAAFREATGAELLDDPALRRLGEEDTLLLHGDTLCTDDHDYQAWRTIARSAAWQREFLGKPLPERRDTIVALREKSREVIQAKPAAIMDVNEDAVRRALGTSGARRMIHGHTHRPGRHAVDVDGRSCERWVLPDWYGRGGYLEVGSNDPRLVYFPK